MGKEIRTVKRVRRKRSRVVLNDARKLFTEIVDLGTIDFQDISPKTLYCGQLFHDVLFLRETFVVLGFEVLVERRFDFQNSAVDEVERVFGTAEKVSFSWTVHDFCEYQILSIVSEVVAVKVELTLSKQEPFCKHSWVSNVNY